MELPEPNPGSEANIFENKTVVCGGGYSAYRNCYEWSSGKWNKYITKMDGDRVYYNSWVSPNGLMLFGSYYSYDSLTTEILQNGNTSPSFKLEYNIQYACAIDDRDSKSVIFTGGNSYKKGASRYNVNVSFKNNILHE